ncbi:UNKNOWN [Stylonychia lemnae]|uniref:Uncharacterized protein n=1 Tax=Stylonychia lemnae TaxID=5949 RepID=A0A077ZS27_STYLE|nr:UNKNOWN [Stylonychia lemnae]|eukprot:CDW72294.1 UNKNOWN [Stylonychia lemnae]
MTVKKNEASSSPLQMCIPDYGYHCCSSVGLSECLDNWSCCGDWCCNSNGQTPYCDTSTYSCTVKPANVGLIVGLSVGIPVFIAIIVIIWMKIKKKGCFKPKQTVGNQFQYGAGNINNQAARTDQQQLLQN